MPLVARIAHIGRYPVKSMRGESLDEAEIGWQGLLGDRRYAFVRANTPSDFPWLTARQTAELLLYAPRFERAPTLAAPEGELTVVTPDHDNLRIDDPRLRALLEQRFGHPLFLLHNKNGCFDSTHLSLLGLPTLFELSGEVGRQLERERFRANLYLEPIDNQARAENAWVGRVLKIGGSARIGITRRNVRCVVPTLDPATAVSDPAILQTIAQRHETCAGVYATVIAQGAIRVGDPVILDE